MVTASRDDDEVWNRLAPYPRFGAGPDLDRALHLMGASLAALPEGIVITGSNGKGTTTHLLAGWLSRQGLRVGQFTSPHLFSVTERVQLQGQPVAARDLATALSDVQRDCDPSVLGRSSRFELITAAAARIFAGAGLDVIVWEAGIGGRFDPTRTVPKRVAALTSVSLEHTALLGDTLEAIALDKADIARDPSGTTVVPLVVGDIDHRLLTRLASQQPVVRHTDEPIHISLGGPHQHTNVQVALTAGRLWMDRPHAPANFDGIAVPGRTECIVPRTRLRPAVFVDVAHHHSAVRALRSWLDGLPRPLVVVFGVSADRHGPPMLDVLPDHATVVLTEAPHKSTPAHAITVDPRPAVEPDLNRALLRAQEQASPAGTVVVLGGLYLAAAAATCLRGEDPTMLRWE